MKQLLVMTALLFLLAGCNVNENKEARIRRLESQIEQTTNKLQEFESRIAAMEAKKSATEK